MTYLKTTLIIAALCVFSSCTKQVPPCPIKGKERVFYKVTNRNLAKYFKNPADSLKLEKIVETGLLQHSKFANDTLENFLIKLGLCNNDMSEMVYVPCIPSIHCVLKMNDAYNNYDTIIGTTNHLLDDYPNHDDEYSFTEIFVKDKDKAIYNPGYNPQRTLSGHLIGYYVEDNGNKSLLLHDEVWWFSEKENFKERFENSMVLFKWENGGYVPDSILTIDDKLIPANEYENARAKYIGDAKY